MLAVLGREEVVDRTLLVMGRVKDHGVGQGERACFYTDRSKKEEDQTRW